MSENAQVEDERVPTRDELLRLLAEAAELEHSLTCQYLFAAFSLKRRTEEGLTEEQLTHVLDWARTILMVARQEMEHLGLVCNLLTVVGGMPWFGHDRFPYPTPLYGHTMSLEPFGVETLRKFVCFERPDEILPEDAFCLEPTPGRNVGALYDRIRSLLVALDGPQLFLGPVAAEVTGVELGTDFPRLGAMGGGYDVSLRAIADLPSALSAIDLVIEQGEGRPSDDAPSHYRRFLDMLEDVEGGPAFEAARAVVHNPVLSPHEGGTVVTNHAARAVMELFDASYRAMLLMLTRLFVHTDESEAEVDTLRGIAFFPLMTMAVRPLAEVLTTMPAHEPDDGTRAGPSFDTGGPVGFLPHRSAAWVVLSEELATLAAHAREVAARPGMPARLSYVAETMALVSRRFNNEINV
jgi:hypothetical protein